MFVSVYVFIFFIYTPLFFFKIIGEKPFWFKNEFLKKYGGLFLFLTLLIYTMGKKKYN